MNDTHEKVWIHVFDEERMTVGGFILHDEDASEAEITSRLCVIMAKAIGRELAREFEPSTAAETAAHCIGLIWNEILRAAHDGQE